MNNDIAPTKMINYDAMEIQKLIKENKWRDLNAYEKIKSIYSYVQNDILFGYNKDDTLNAQEVLQDGYGQCNTKATLLMALLRGVEIPCRIHGFEVSKDFQRGATSHLVSLFAPKLIIHTWVEVYYDNQWLALEGVIIDKVYFEAVKAKVQGKQEKFAYYAIATNDLQSLCIDWDGHATYVQSAAIVHDLGVFLSPDEFFKRYAQDLGYIKKWLYTHIGRRIMNRNVKMIRNRS